MNDPNLPEKIKQMLVDSLMLKVSPGDIDDNAPLFGPEGLGLDSIDALELSVAVEKQFGAPVPNSEVAREAFANVTALARHIEKNSTTAG